jgi:hypothetical protein
MESEMKLLWQHPARLYRIRSHHFQQEPFYSDAVVLELLRITQQQFFSDTAQ